MSASVRYSPARPLSDGRRCGPRDVPFLHPLLAGLNGLPYLLRNSVHQLPHLCWGRRILCDLDIDGALRRLRFLAVETSTLWPTLQGNFAQLYLSSGLGKNHFAIGRDNPYARVRSRKVKSSFFAQGRENGPSAENFSIGRA